jgi:integrase
MSDLNIQNGAQIACTVPRSAEESAPIRANVESLADLLSFLNTKPTSQTPMLRSAAVKIASYLDKSMDQISLDLIHANREGFRPFLESQRHKEGAVRAYVNYLRMLLGAAGELGWKPHARLSKEWQSVLDQAKKNECLTITKFLAQTKKSPEQIMSEDLERWIEASVKGGMRYATAATNVSKIWRTLVDCGYVKNVPIACFRQKNYGVHISKFPSPLKEEVAELKRWKSAEYEPERSNRARIRKVSAESVQQTFSSLFGFATRIQKNGDIKSLSQLIQKHIIEAYISWCVNERELKGGPLIPQLAAVLAAVSKHPAHRKMDLTWYRPLLETIPKESYEEVRARKAKKYLDYDVLESIPLQIRARRASEAKLGMEHVARLVMEELMVKWLLVFLWRQRNLRECRVEGQNPNLFKAKLPVYSYIDKPAWARQEEADNPNAEFWQIRFSREETKTGVSVHSLVPRSLIKLLEEYMSEYRPLLLRGRKYETLFVCPEADEMNSSSVTDIISELTLRYGGRRVTPHLFRDVVAFAWLKSHPEDYLTLSKMLWHKHISTTIHYYGGRFNESSASVAMESWIEEREARSKSK